MPYSLPVGMGLTLAGLLFLSIAGNFITLLMAAALVGTGSSVFHPESSEWPEWHPADNMAWHNRYFRLAAMQDSSLGPLMAAFIVMRGDNPASPGFRLRPWPGYSSSRRSAGWAIKNRSTVKKAGAVRQEHRPILSKRRVVLSIASNGSAVFKIRLSGEPDQLLHVLFDE